jgi:hypothetical protein
MVISIAEATHTEENFLVFPDIENLEKRGTPVFRFR